MPKILTEETKRKISEAHKGKKLSEKTRRKISEGESGEKNWNYGKHWSEEIKQKMSKAHKGKHHTEETKRKFSLIRKGENNSNYGKHCSEETKRKIGLVHKGKPLTEKWKQKISKSLKGEKCYKWKGGISPITELIRKSLKYKLWRSDVFIRDNFTCQKCGIKGGILNAHHKKSFSILIQEIKINLPLLSLYEGAMAYTPLWDIDNGITLCEECHKKEK